MTIRSKYFGVGFCFGLCFPIGAIIFEMILKGNTDILLLHNQNKILYMIDSAPIFLGLFAYIGGRFQEKAQNISADLDQNMENLEVSYKVQTEQTNRMKETSIQINQTSKELMDNLSVINNNFDAINTVTEELIVCIEDVKESSATMEIDSTRIDEEVAEISEELLQSLNHLKAFKSIVSLLSEMIYKMDHELQAELKQFTLLEGEIDEIANLKDAIDHISSQIDLLSLNASIEAARAGEAGKGFSVVANEIKKLSTESYQSTAMIDSVIQKVKSRSDAIINNIDVQKHNVDDIKSKLNDLLSQVELIFNSQNNEQKMIVNIEKSSALQHEHNTLLNDSLKLILTEIDKISQKLSDSQDSLTYNQEKIIQLNAFNS